MLSTSPPSSILFTSLGSHGVASVFSHLRRQRNGGNPPRSTTLGDLTVTPPSSVVFGTVETHHDRRLDDDYSIFCHLRCERNDGEGDDFVGLLRRSFRWLSRSIQLPDQLPK
uniref:Uncharacterized protein n=1 Tax=Brassica oleracea TaxID=3712 RepID=A0A3P6F2C6_BRAOL|nr:unnamed protein product [Brassica oleracea]